MKYTIFIYPLLIVSLTTNIFVSFGQTIKNPDKPKIGITVNKQHTENPLILNYTFKDQTGKDTKISDFKGRFVVIDLWFTGCGACIMANKALKMVHDTLNNKNIVFLSISIDKNKKMWLQSIARKIKPNNFNNWAGKYCPARGTVTLYTGGTGQDNPFIKEYVPLGFYPKLLLIGPTGKVLSEDLPRPDPDPQVLIDFIRRSYR
jgi:thiol-disulfide isomerase/thioredoxin